MNETKESPQSQKQVDRVWNKRQYYPGRETIDKATGEHITILPSSKDRGVAYARNADGSLRRVRLIP